MLDRRAPTTTTPRPSGKRIAVVSDVMRRLGESAVIWGYGAAGKATMWVNLCDMAYLRGLVDASPLRAGKLMLGATGQRLEVEKLGPVDTEVELTPREFALLRCLLRQAGSVVVACSGCHVRTRISVTDVLMRLASISLWIPGRKKGHWMRCPACEQRITDGIEKMVGADRHGAGIHPGARRSWCRSSAHAIPAGPGLHARPSVTFSAATD
jgi:hypothetical protein